MLPKTNRVSKKLFQKVWKSGHSLGSTLLSFRFLATVDAPENKISFIVPRRIYKTAVERNKLRRMGYTAIKKYLKNFTPNLAGVFTLKAKVKSVAELEKEIGIILKKI